MFIFTFFLITIGTPKRSSLKKPVAPVKPQTKPKPGSENIYQNVTLQRDSPTGTMSVDDNMNEKSNNSENIMKPPVGLKPKLPQKPPKRAEEHEEVEESEKNQVVNPLNDFFFFVTGK